MLASEITAVPRLPSYEALLAIDWLDSVWETHQRLRDTETNDDRGAPKRYLELQYRLNTEPRLPIAIQDNGRINYTALTEGLKLILHPHQLPLTLKDLVVR